MAYKTLFLNTFYNISIYKWAKVDKIIFSNENNRPDKSAIAITNNIEIFIPLEGLIDFEVESSRLKKRLGELEKHVSASKNKLSNDNFIKKQTI